MRNCIILGLGAGIDNTEDYQFIIKTEEFTAQTTITPEEYAVIQPVVSRMNIGIGLDSATETTTGGPSVPIGGN